MSKTDEVVKEIRDFIQEESRGLTPEQYAEVLETVLADCRMWLDCVRDEMERDAQ